MTNGHDAKRASHTTHAFGPRTASRGYTFEACVFEANRFGGEVVVLATVVEVVVLGRSGSRRSRDGSGSSGTRRR